MPSLFEATSINGLKLKNRFIRSATYEALANPDGTVTDNLIEYLLELVGGGIGLVITSHTYVSPEGQAGPRQMGIYSDAMLDGLKRLTSAIHHHGGVVAVQLAHAGTRGTGEGTFGPRGPVDVYQEGVKKVRAMTKEDIRETTTAFGEAAARAVEAGFDAVQIHAAHGYLLSQFLSPYYNNRGDSYGGTLENRARFLLEVCEEIRRRVGTSVPLTAKLNSEDFLENGLSSAESIEVVRLLETRGLDALEMSGGTFDSGAHIPSRTGTSESESREVYYREAAASLKKSCRIPLILVGGFLSFSSCEKAIASGIADYIALSRPLIKEPDLINRWAQGDTAKASCISCNKCFATLFTAEGLHCAIVKKRTAA